MQMLFNANVTINIITREDMRITLLRSDVNMMALLLRYGIDFHEVIYVKSSPTKDTDKLKTLMANQEIQDPLQENGYDETTIGQIFDSICR